MSNETSLVHELDCAENTAVYRPHTDEEQRAFEATVKDHQVIMNLVAQKKASINNTLNIIKTNNPEIHTLLAHLLGVPNGSE